MPKMTSEIALGLVKEIEALNEQITAVYRKAGEYDDYNNANVIRDIVEARAAENDAKSEAEGMLKSFDIEDDSGI